MSDMITLRLSPEQLASLDRIVAAERARVGVGGVVSRSSVLRMLIERYAATLDADTPKSPPKKRA